MTYGRCATLVNPGSCGGGLARVGTRFTTEFPMTTTTTVPGRLDPARPAPQPSPLARPRQARPIRRRAFWPSMAGGSPLTTRAGTGLVDRQRWYCRVSLRAAGFPRARPRRSRAMCGSVGAAVHGDVGSVAEVRNGQVDGRPRAVLARLGLGELDRPARVPVLVPAPLTLEKFLSCRRPRRGSPR